MTLEELRMRGVERRMEEESACFRDVPRLNRIRVEKLCD